MNSRVALIGLLVFEIVGLCLCGALIASIGFGFWQEQPRPVVVNPTRAVATPTPNIASRAPATLVIPLPRTATPSPRPPITVQTPIVFVTATRTGSSTSPGAYNLIVPTPTAPRVIYPVTFQSNFTVATYQVSGKTLDELSKSLDANAMPDPHESNGRYYARTNWQLLADWAWKENLGRCELDHATVSIVVTITLPSLASTTGMRPEVLNRWNTFVQNTQTHEIGHVKLAQQGARDYQRDLGNYPAAPDCTTMAVKLKNLYDQEFAAIEKSNVDYDKQTQHGLTQGAVFP